MCHLPSFFPRTPDTLTPSSPISSDELSGEQTHKRMILTILFLKRKNRDKKGRKLEIAGNHGTPFLQEEKETMYMYIDITFQNILWEKRVCPAT